MYKNNISFKLILWAILLFSIINSCGVVGVNKENNATLLFSVKAINSSSNNLINNKIQKDTLGIFPEFNSTSIASGAAEDLKLYIKSIKLSDSEDDEGDEIIFSNPNGKSISIHSGKVDISSLFSATILPEACTLSNGESFVFENTNVIASNENNGTVILSEFEENENGEIILTQIVNTISCPHTNSAKLEIPAKHYKNVKIEFLRRAKIKGCVSANFSEAETKDGIEGKHTYCTQKGKSTFDNENTQNIDFEKTVSELMDIDLKMLSGQTSNRDESFTITYPIKEGITLTPNTKTTLTVLFDLNRFLRYFNNGRIDNQAPNFNAPNGSSYFYTLDLKQDNVAYAFVGEVGSIYGYRSVLEGCTHLPMPTNRVCSTIKQTLGFWMTSVYDKNNQHIKTTFMPDDDNALTTIKGSTDNIVNAINHDGRIDIHYGLSSGERGILFNFKHADKLQDKVNNVSFEGFQEFYGQVYMQRKL